MIDKLEIRVPWDAPFTSSFGALYGELRSGRVDPFRKTQHYGAVADLRTFGFECILHCFCKHGKSTHKVELLETGRRSLDELMELVRNVFAVRERELAVMRIDLAIDVKDIPVSWFHTHAIVRYKRLLSEIGTLEFRNMSKKHNFETLYFGRRPNLVRIYDKIGEKRAQYEKLKRAAKEELPAFEELYGFPQSGLTLTRIERQFGGSRIPPPISTIKGLRKHLLHFNPFDVLQIAKSNYSLIESSELRADDYLKGMGLRTLVEEKGLQRSKKFLNARSGGHAAKYFERYAGFIPSEIPIDHVPNLADLFYESVSRQMRAA